MPDSSWKERARLRQDALTDKIPIDWRIPAPSLSQYKDVMAIPESCGILNAEELAITDSDVSTLLSNIGQGNWSAEHVVTAFCKRAAIAHQLLNCLTDVFFTEAIETARQYDCYRRSTGKLKGPLHGLPMSLKDCFAITGTESNYGLVSRIGAISSEDAALLTCLRESGAIPFVKTNLAQGMLLVESTNNIFGTVLNPWNRNLSAGGSSGGEGALVAFHGSPLGIGTDGGGSLRIPAAWNGIYTLKPSGARLPSRGMKGVGYSNSNPACVGPFANDLRTLSLFCETVIGRQPWLNDPSCVPMPWNDNVDIPQKLRIGLLVDDGIVNPSPPVSRVLAQAAHSLRAAGHEIIDLDWGDMHRRGAKIIFTIYTHEGGVGIREALEESGEPPVPRLATGWSEGPLSPKEIWLNLRSREQFRFEYAKEWQRLGLDVVITAPSPHPAPPHGEYITSAISAIYNLLDYPCCIIPCGRVDQSRDAATKHWYDERPHDPIPDFPYDRYDENMKRLYKGPELFMNAPLGLQIVCSILQEERCLRAAEVIDRVVNSQA